MICLCERNPYFEKNGADYLVESYLSDGANRFATIRDMARFETIIVGESSSYNQNV